MRVMALFTSGKIRVQLKKKYSTSLFNLFMYVFLVRQILYTSSWNQYSLEL